MTVEYYDNGTWKTLQTKKLVQTTPEAVQALNWRVGKDKTHSFWKNLGSAIAQDAAASLVQGLQPQPQQ